jgi:hypothetical protein
MKKPHLSVYLDHQILVQLSQLAARKGTSKSLIAEAAIIAFLTPDESDQREGALTRRLDLLTRQTERVERNVTVAAETLALFVRSWLSATPVLPDVSEAAAQAKGRERFEGFLEALGRRLASGQTLLREVPLDRTREGAPN